MKLIHPPHQRCLAQSCPCARALTKAGSSPTNHKWTKPKFTPGMCTLFRKGAAPMQMMGDSDGGDIVLLTDP